MDPQHCDTPHSTPAMWSSSIGHDSHLFFLSCSDPQGMGAGRVLEAKKPLMNLLLPIHPSQIASWTRWHRATEIFPPRFLTLPSQFLFGLLEVS